MAAISTIGVATAVGAAATVAVVSEVSKCAGNIFKVDLDSEVQVKGDASAEYIGRVRCKVRGSMFKLKRHVTLLGDVVIVSRRTGSADAMVPLRGAEVSETESGEVAVHSEDGEVLLRFWLGCAEEAREWASTLRGASAAGLEVPKMLSLTRAQLEELKADRGGSGFSAEQILELEAELVRKETELETLQKELDGFKDAPNLLNLTKQQLAEVESACAAKEERIAQLVAELEGRDPVQVQELKAEVAAKDGQVAALQAQVDNLTQNAPRQLSLTRRQVAELEHEASQKDGQVAQLQAELEGVREMPKMLSLSRRQVRELEAQAAQKDREVAELEGQLAATRDVPKQLSTKLREMNQLQAEASEKDEQISALRKELENINQVSKLPTLSQTQLRELQDKTAAKEREIEELRQRHAADMASRPVRYIGVPVAQAVGPHVPRATAAPGPVRLVSVPGRTRWGAQIQMVRQRVLPPGATYVRAAMPVRSASVVGSAAAESPMKPILEQPSPAKSAARVKSPSSPRGSVSSSSAQQALPAGALGA